MKGALALILVPSAFAAVGGAIGAAAGGRHPAVGAFVGAAVSTSVLWGYAVAFSGGFEEQKPSSKQVGTSGTSLHLSSRGGFP